MLLLSVCRCETLQVRPGLEALPLAQGGQSRCLGQQGALQVRPGTGRRGGSRPGEWEHGQVNAMGMVG